MLVQRPSHLVRRRLAYLRSSHHFIPLTGPHVPVPRGCHVASPTAWHATAPRALCTSVAHPGRGARTQAPLVLIICFARCSEGPAGPSRIMHTSPGQIPSTYLSSLATHWIPVITGILSKQPSFTPAPPSVRSGHYTTVLCGDAAALFCDDNVAPQRLGLDSELRCEQGYGSREVYLLVCRRGEARH